jgi:hypothetical protein
MLKFDSVIVAKHEVDEDAHNPAVFSKKAGRLVNAQSRRAGRKRDEIGIASETIQFFRQNSLHVPEIAQSLQRVIEPFGVDESSRRRHPTCPD